MRTLLVDNYDSYTYNLAELIARVTGVEPIIVGNDELTCEEAVRLPIDAIVLSAGPGSAAHARDIGIAAELLGSATVPILGVCLGHQIIAHQSGALVEPAEHPAHGIISAVRLDDDPLFRGLPRAIKVVRYHSLAVSAPLPSALRGIATADDGTIMALRHRSRPHWGVQFHPEAACTEYGAQLIENFAEIVGARKVRSPIAVRAERPIEAGTSPMTEKSTPIRLTMSRVEVDSGIDSLRAYEALYRDRPYSFWLDTNATRESHGWSFMGAMSAARDHLLTARGHLVTEIDAAGHATTYPVDSVWRHLDQRLHHYRVEFEETPAADETDGVRPMPFRGGYVGYLGYGLSTSLVDVAHPGDRTPDLALLFVSRFLAFDHVSGRLFACAVHTDAEADAVRRWLADVVELLGKFGAEGGTSHPAGADDVDPDALEQALRASALVPRADYEHKVRACIDEIRAGETYEVCLTTGFEGPSLRDPFGVYRTLRRVNPAPYAAFLDLGDVQILSSSPERFLRISPAGRVETKPIKGTSARGATPAEDVRAARGLATDPKMRAENMMIVDLLRNDLNRVCRVGTVAVDALMHVETYQTVHQLVSTISGRLRDGRSPIDAVEACFPGGSMTGAPKLNTMKIISRVEPHARGPYAGALGVFSLDGYVDLSIVIRTIVNDPSRWFVGAGGAVLMTSDPAAEYAEMIQKATPPMLAIAQSGTPGYSGGPCTQ